MFTPVATTAWSTVYRIDSTKDIYFLKKNPDTFANEGLVLDILSRTKAGKYIPELIGFNNNIVLTKYAGLPICKELTSNCDLVKLYDVIDAYIELQTSVSNDALHMSKCRILASDTLFEYTLSMVHKYYKPRFVKVEDASLDLRLLSNKIHMSRDLFEQLCLLNIPDMFEHSDFHLGNVLYNGHSPLIIDFSETTISNPMFSLISFMSSVERRLHIYPNQTAYQLLVRYYLDKFSEKTGISREHVEQLYNVSIALYPFYYIATMGHIIERHIKHNLIPYYQARLELCVKQINTTCLSLLTNKT